MKKIRLICLFVCFTQFISAQDKLLSILKDELNRSFPILKNESEPAYYMSYRVYDTKNYHIQSSFGNILTSIFRENRTFRTLVRVGNHEIDNTREIKDGSSWGNANMSVSLPLEDDPLAIKTVLWKNTDQTYKGAVNQYEKVKANKAVKVASEDLSDDFSHENPEKYYEKPIAFKTVFSDIKTWEEKLKKYTAVFNENKSLINGGANLNVELIRKYFVDSDGAEIIENKYAYRLSINGLIVADDGMFLPLYKSYFAYNLKDFPSDEEIIKDVREISQRLSELKNAPVAESYSGPVLMTARASGVFFHEIFGHRIEGARLKKENDAQTFKKKIGELVLPEDISILFDPQIKEYKKMPLNGSYIYDDEGVKGQKVKIVENGILKSFLMSRVPIQGFSNSNGHGRGTIQNNPVTRQSNMIIESNNAKSEKELREMLIEESKKQNKEYAYLIDEVSGGFTNTARYMPNAFNVNPLIVYRIYVDGRPDELVRGVDLIGTPLAMFSQIAACGSEYDVFNGYCGAESGSIPVSCVSPSLFVKRVETQRKAKGQNQPPILERP